MGRETDDAVFVPYGYRRVRGSEKRRLVLQHFDHVAWRYDLADALLSFGLHFRWRKVAMERLRLKEKFRFLDLCGVPPQKFRFLDLCGGTGEFAMMAAGKLADQGLTLVCDMNGSMMQAGKSRARRTPWGKSIFWVKGDAEELGFPDCSFDAMTVGFGVRNLVNLEKGLREMFRVLKERGKLVILEFSMPVSSWLRGLYDLYSFKIMPHLGRLITGKSDPFLYLAESVRTFPSPEKVADAIRAVGFRHVEFERLTNGLVTVYSGEKHEKHTDKDGGMLGSS
ncbi:MAG: UDP-3-O-(3-hydroxymyristoyl)glucosamine N-acyltransferase [Deltaproteobacteria bacterium HGW-Deltaproteobacteria-15]|jgi:demethylmenaquinone methyltransferase/2-methoxy-6-polyprenyl-1,4-benzoquinol methylase|nr:MAG: UDP-3-O-(3-hydroxymyristoyl)glucosamine N-acyltransferase [Deltaproteobacteria bacterium HGW-Deltaproteobacteria-15]